VLDDQGEVRQHVKVLVDGRNVKDRRKLTDRLNKDSEVYVFQALSGG
jgi:molybdopterin synthase sulfur carrier subunit